MVHRENVTYPLIAIVLDVIGTLGALALATYLRDTLPLGAFIPVTVQTPLNIAGLTVLIWLVVSFIFSVYDPRRNARLIDELQRVIAASLFALLTLAGALYFFSDRTISRLLIVYFYALNLIALIGWRGVARVVYRAVRGGRNAHPRRVLIIGANELGQQVAEMIREHGWSGLQVVGYADDAPAIPEVPLMGGLADVPRIVESTPIEEVIITLAYREYDRLNDLILELAKLPVQVRIAPNYLNLVLYRATVEDFSGMPLINLRDPALTVYQRMVKRAFDLIVGSLTTLVALPLMAVIALAIRLDSPGPILFRQKRVGENGRLFTMLKFRTMTPDAEARQSEVTYVDEAGNVLYKVYDDPRVTRIGRFLRRSSLDELPQLFNVLRGEMSLVGPRPELPLLVANYQPWQRKRFAVPQGMTGWWQVNGRSNKPMHLNTEDDLYYIQNYSLFLDIIILWRTVFAVIRRRGAY